MNGNGNGNGHSGTSPMVHTSSGLEVEQDGETKSITEVINTFELIGDDVRANLIKAIRAVVMEAREAQQAAKNYVQTEHRAQKGSRQ